MPLARERARGAAPASSGSRAPPDWEPVVRVEGLSRRYDEVWALREVSFEVGRGELFGVVGPDGAGKTTLMQSLCAILDPTAGRVAVGRFDSVADAARITATIGYVSQAYSLYGDLTVAENLQFFAEVRKVPPAEIARRRERLLRFSGLGRFLDRRAKHLSGGMQKKLALACSIVHEPELVILDEPTLGVDPLSRRELWHMLDEFRAAGKTVVVATSYMDEAARCDRVLFLAGGRVVACDAPATFGADLEAAFETMQGPPHAIASIPFVRHPRAGDAIRVEGLTRRFGDFVAVDHATFTVAAGEIFGLLGPNGSGKSTLIRMLCGILPASGGTARVAGIDVTAAAESARARLGYMSQRFSLYLDLTVDENVAFFGAAYGLAPDALRSARDWIVAMAGLEGRGRTIVKALSGALRQRLALGCAVLHDPGVLFLDEPTSGVDPASRAAFWRLIAAIADTGTAVLVTTHYLREAEACHRVAFIDAGRILAIDPPASLRARYGAASLEEAFLNAMGAAA